jgi:regulator of protease activity HflC (stomatin/prohibitin superfamily)
MAAFNLKALYYKLLYGSGSGGGGGGSSRRQPPPGSFRGGGGPPPRRGPLGSWRDLFVLLLGALILYAGYFWIERRYVVDADEVLVLLKKNGSKSLPGDQVVIPDPAHFAGGPAAWDEQYRDANGILEQVYLTGTYFGFSPFDYERRSFPIAEVPPGKVGIVIRRFGAPLAPGEVLAGPGKRGPLPGFRQPGKYPEFSNPYAYELKLVDPVNIDPGYRGVVTVMAGKSPARPNEYLVEPGERGVQRTTEPEGFRFVNPYEQRITPISMKSQRFEMAGADAIKFPSSDSFDITMEGFVEWSIIPDKLPLIYTQYAEGGELVEFMEAKVILPYARSFSRLMGSRFLARDFISGDTKLQFQREFSEKLTAACRDQGILIHQALVRDIVPPGEIKDPINEREVARQQIKTIEERIKVARSQAELAKQEALAEQNKGIGEANKQVVTITTNANQESDVAITKANEELAVAKLRLQAAKRQSEAQVAKGTADANVILLNRQAEAEPLKQQVAAFGGDGNEYARYFFYQKVAPSVKSILTDTNGPFGDLFRQFTSPSPTASPKGGGGGATPTKGPTASASPNKAEGAHE